MALCNNTTGSANTASGWGALRANTTGSFNTASGDSALYFNTTGFENTAIGVSTPGPTPPDNNTATGGEALRV